VPYSIASAEHPAHGGEFELAVSADGGQDLLARLAPGATVFVSTPRGEFVWQPGSGSTLLIGMGTGLAPLRAMLQASLGRDSKQRIALLFGARSEADILFRSEFEELESREARFSFEPTLSRPGGTWTGRTGRVQEHLPSLLTRLDEVSVYVCGTRAMVADCLGRLTGELGLHPTRIRSEAH
jgi:NAD(P)H-flavin reductase